jgi:hypothetical protein
MYPTFFPTLMADASVTAVLGSNPTRVWPHREAPQTGTQFYQLPYATHQLIIGSPENYLSGAPDIDGFRIQFNFYGETSAQVIEAAAAVRSALEDIAYVVSLNGTGRDPDTDNYTYSFDVEFMSSR